MTTPKRPQQKSLQECITQAAEEAKERKTFFSFGDEGLTATVSASGRLLRISRYFPGKKKSFCVDGPEMSEPWFVVSRFRKLLSLAEGSPSAGGIGPAIEGICVENVVNDRWPTFKRGIELENNTNDTPEIKLQYVAFDATIYQRFQFTNYNPAPDKGSQETGYYVTELSIESDMLLRDLDFVDGRNRFNEAGPDHKLYSYSVAKNLFTRTHVNEKNEGVVLRIRVLDKDGSVEFSELGQTGQPDQSSDGRPRVMVHRKPLKAANPAKSNTKGDTFAITLAYTLECFPSAQTAEPSMQTLELDKAIEKVDELLQRREEYELTGDPAIDFFLRRNLEYFISVCAIPTLDSQDKAKPSYALTCGDVESHRVATPASFYVFQFLLKALRLFRKKAASAPTSNVLDPDPMECMRDMAERIERICLGHVRWLLLEINTPESFFCPNHWISGERIVRQENESYLPEKSLVDAPFQIIKACDFLGLMNQHEFPDLRSALKDYIEAWIEDLDSINRLGLYAFPRYDENATFSFYLADHALIWQAMKSAENIGLDLELKVTTSKPYSSETLKLNMLRRFTTKNAQADKRMIAVTRSPIRSRFLLRSRDTALFPAMDLGFFDNLETAKKKTTDWQRRVDVWRNTIDCQKDHEYNDDLKWSDPRRFMLSLLMAWNHKPINSRSETGMHQHAISVLLKASSYNGLFPGWLDEGRGPARYNYEGFRDAYWETAFEIPYVLWKYYEATRIGRAETRHGTDAPPTNFKDTELLEELKSLSRSTNLIGNLLKEGPGLLTTQKRSRRQFECSMKVFHPFNNVMDESNLVELQDEWLFKEPLFFVPRGSKGPGTVNQGFRKYQTKPFSGFVADVPRSNISEKRKPGDGDDAGQQIRATQSRDKVQGITEVGRTVESAEKRLWAFFSPSSRGNEACLDTFLDEEKIGKEMENFFSRHESYGVVFEEETVAALNTWTTEIHLSFYCLDHRATEVIKQSTTEIIEKGPSLPTGEGNPLLKVALSFRFEGDLFNRYWTCRYLEADPSRVQKHEDEDAYALFDDLVHFENGHSKVWEEDFWKQRRVFELMLFGKLLQRLNHETRKVLSEAKRSLCKSSQIAHQDIPGKTSTSMDAEYDVLLTRTDSFLSSRKLIEAVQRVLRAMVGNLEENIGQITLWQNREKDRQAERPRWDIDDEIRFRVTIQKLQVSNDHQFLELNRLLLNISKLEEFLAKKLDIIRSDLEERRGGETQLFTWVTVVFLPLGFATGVFSMSEAPTSQTLHSMIITAVVALVSIALLGPVVKSVISADVIRLPEFTNWNAEDWSEWRKRRREVLKTIWETNKTTWRMATAGTRETLRGQWEMDKATWRMATAGLRETLRGQWEMDKKTWRMATDWPREMAGTVWQVFMYACNAVVGRWKAGWREMIRTVWEALTYVGEMVADRWMLELTRRRRLGAEDIEGRRR